MISANNKLILSPSILSANFYNISKEIEVLNKYNVKYLHLDVMDGIFVPNISFGIPVIKSLKKQIKNMIFDTHLMIVEPQRYIKQFKDSGSDILTVHLETLENPKEVFNQIKENGMKVSVVINPETDVEKVYNCINDVDMVLLMSVHPGFGGQSFIDTTYDKIKKLRQEAIKQSKNIDIEVDGGIDFNNMRNVIEAGANILVMGSSIFNGNIEENLQKYFEIAKEYD